LISIDATALVISVLVFGLVFVLKNFFFEPMAQAMEARQKKIDTAEHAWEDAERAIADARSSVDDAVQGVRNEGYQLLDTARAEAQKDGRGTVDEGREQAQALVGSAKKRLAEETDNAVAALEKDADALAAQIATRILGRDVA